MQHTVTRTTIPRTSGRRGRNNYRFDEKLDMLNAIERDKAQFRREIEQMSDDDKLRLMTDHWWEWACDEKKP